jgi:hypothetical protein
MVSYYFTSNRSPTPIESFEELTLQLTHYHHRDEPPFQNLSALTREDAIRVMMGLRNRSGTVYRRFQNPQEYIEQRQQVESWVRQEFINKGGRPVNTYPHYFVVGRSLWIEEGYQNQYLSTHYPITAFDPSQVSFTYPDSMISYWLKSQTQQIFYRPEYHGQVFGLSEIQKIIDLFGVPIDEWRNDEIRKHDLFIEAQVWSGIPDQDCESRKIFNSIVTRENRT